MSVHRELFTKALDRRRYTRVSVNNTVVYILLDKTVSKIGVGTGSVINISQNGLMLQTDHIISSNYIYLVLKNMDKKMVPIIGKVIFSMKSEDGLFRTGICLKGDHEDNVEFRKNLIRIFHRKNVLGLLRNQY